MTDDETDEQRADREATEADHARGNHTYCGITCEVEMPTEHLWNFVIAKGYPGTKGALDELLRRARTEGATSADSDALQRVRAVLETEHVTGRSALDYRGLILTALTANEPKET